MHLKSLKLSGFKSFADRTRLEFRPGVTVVVGPNGSGKSNLVDALSWVLGTRSTKSLRTPKMEDVIFAGTATRRPLGKAEVTLVIDNEDRTLGLDRDEVAITRRLYRDGSSDYEINGAGCRLLDIQDLLADAGVGRHQHVIIGQGEVGRALDASPAEHRVVIEEAAGILKHKRRKEKSERRLERTDEDLERLGDLLGEMNRQMRPLKRQAKASERYDRLKSEIVALRRYLARQALEEHDRELDTLRSEKLHISENAEDNAGLVERLGRTLSELTESASRVSADLDQATEAAARLEKTSESLRRVASVSEERRRALNGRIDATFERRYEYEEEASVITVEIESVTSEIEAAESHAVEAEKRFRKAEDDERLAAMGSFLSLEGAVAAVNGEISSLEASLVRDHREEQNIQTRIETLDRQMAHDSAEIQTTDEQVKDLGTRLRSDRIACEQARLARSRDEECWTDSAAMLGEAKLAVAATLARVEAIERALSDRHDPEARADAEKARGAIGALLSLLDIPTGLEPAVKSALGQWVDAVAFDRTDSVRDVIESIKGAGGGSVQLVASDTKTGEDATGIAEASGLETLVSRLGPRARLDLAKPLIGDVVVVEGWATGWDLIQRNPRLRAVTPEGDLIAPTGVVMADPGGDRSAVMQSAEAALEKSRAELARAESVHASASRDLERSRKVERLALEAVEASEARLGGASEAMVKLHDSVDVKKAESERLGVRASQLRVTVADTESRVAGLRERLKTLEGEEADRMAAWEEARAVSLRLGAARELARSHWHEAATRHRGMVERERMLTDRLTRIGDQLARFESDRSITGGPEVLSRIETCARKAERSIERRLIELRERQAELRTENAEVLNALAAVRDQRDRARSALAGGQERTGQIEVRLTELRMRREAITEAVRRDTNGGVSDVMAAQRPEVPEDADLEELLESKSSRLRRLGPINPLAASEYAELEERHTFLTDQIADVETSRTELRKVIKALEDEIEQRFAEAFEEVSHAYRRYFDVLFPGGKGKIHPVDPDDPQTGVVIDAQPLGKKVSQMTLLSGGERSLAALAFLFAVFEVRPSPFYILDEVEAALDDVNLRRFIRLVDEFRSRAQIVIVTHQQPTMEAADVLYGVTMEPGGASQALRKEMTIVATSQVA